MSTAFLAVVRVKAKPEFVASFKEASLANARQSRFEAGIYQFELAQQQDDPTSFLLLEGYRTAEAAVAHKATAHYATWRDAVAEMMAEPRSSTKWLPQG